MIPRGYEAKRRYKPSTITAAHVVAVVFAVGMLGMLLFLYWIGVGGS